ncbi:hypothetical protein X798_03450 [Onchocerca flexuosa]|uniref:Small acidic protein-like domain-containing protein n=1 Tax=Onchocerca flexuosa TaxID=387005 RepID=A0A238BW01_9BILA|nr:hypothetical protein X798_03450 [Onchocerca flexuosa]
MTDNSFRPLTAKEIRKHIERRSDDRQSQEKQKKRSDDDDDKNRSNDIVRKKCHDDDRFCDWKHGRERRGRSMERHSDNRHRSDKHGHGREVDSVVQGRSSGCGHSRERSRDRYSNKEKEDRPVHRGHYYKESERRIATLFLTLLERLETAQKQQTIVRTKSKYSEEPSLSTSQCSASTLCLYGSEDDEDGNSDRPAWATKAVVKRAEEIQKRKLIWSKPEEKKELESDTVSSSVIGLRPSTTSTWNSILAASSSDSKQLDKFKRLMGMKKTDEEDQGETSKMDDNQVEAERKRQHELYSHLDHQYAVARSFTHLGRGQGLGFHQ